MTRLIVLLLFSSAVLARDPFSPVSTVVCDGQFHAASQWRLLGVLGKEGQMISRWYSPTGRSVTLAQQTWPDEPDLRISEINLSGVTLSGQGECQSLRYHYPLKKRLSDAKKSVVNRYVAAGEIRKGNGAVDLHDLQRSVSGGSVADAG